LLFGDDIEFSIDYRASGERAGKLSVSFAGLDTELTATDDLIVDAIITWSQYIDECIVIAKGFARWSLLKHEEIVFTRAERNSSRMTAHFNGLTIDCNREEGEQEDDGATKFRTMIVIYRQLPRDVLSKMRTK